MRMIKPLIALMVCLFVGQSSKFELSITLPRYTHATLYVSPLKITLGVNLSLDIAYLQTTSNNSSNSVSIYSTSMIQTTQTFKYAIWNFQNNDQSIIITVAATEDVNLTQKILKVSKQENRPLITAIFDKQTSSGYILPFNMLNNKISSVYVVQYDAALVERTYNLQTFMSTYWNQISSNIQIFTHFPYLSQCSLQKPYLILNDLIQPQSCELDTFYGVVCEDRNIDFSCIIEQLQVSNVGLQFWFNKDQCNFSPILELLFYLFKNQLSMEQFNKIKLSLIGTNKLVTSVFEDIVPVVYYRKSTDPVIVNQYKIQFKVTVDSNSQIQIVSAEIHGYFNQDIALPNAIIHTHVIYLNIFERFQSFNLPIFYYIIYALIIDAILMASIWLATSKMCVIDIRRKIQSILSPALKGCLYMLLTGGCFFFMLNQLTFQTNYSGIMSLYGDSLADQSLQLNNIGRNGLTIAFIGFYLLNAAIKQSFKITQNQDLKTFFEDDLRLNQNKAVLGQNFSEKVQFTRKNMVSHKKYILISSILVIFFGFFFVQIVFSLSNFASAMLILFLIPFVGKFTIESMRINISKQLLYICGYLLSFMLIFILIVFKSKNIWQFTYLYFCRYFNLYFQIFAIQLLFDKGIHKINELSQQNAFFKLLSKILDPIIQFKIKESQYQKSLFMSSAIIIQLLSVVITPLICLTVYIVNRNGILESTLLIEQTPMYFAFVMIVMFVPMEIYTIFAVIQFLKKYNYRIEEVIRFNHFKFKRRRFKWMNDQFSQSSNIHSFYREYQKFSFSSQLYFVISLLGYGIFLIYLGFMIIIQSGYSFGYDPALLMIGIIVITCGDIMAFGVSVLVATKLKLYEKKQDQFIRQNLNKTQKYLKNNDANDFLQYEGVKEYFIMYSKDWIIQNLHKIFERQDLQENNCEIIAKYKHYKSMFKKQEMQQKRKLKELKQTSHNNRIAQLIHQNKIIFNKNVFTLIKPIMNYWLYLSKQNLYLKNIIGCVKTEKMKKNCQFCNMDFQLQALQKRDFQQLVNQYRVLNVNKFFDPQTFLEFYRINQKYITICIECKEKNLHLQNQFTLKQVSSKLVKKWHFMAKSILLHRKLLDK